MDDSERLLRSAFDRAKRIEDKPVGPPLLLQIAVGCLSMVVVTTVALVVWTTVFMLTNWGGSGVGTGPAERVERIALVLMAIWLFDRELQRRLGWRA